MKVRRVLIRKSHISVKKQDKEYTATVHKDTEAHKCSDKYTVDVPATKTENGTRSKHCTDENCEAVSDVQEDVVWVPVSSITLNKKEIRVTNDTPFELDAVVAPEDASNQDLSCHPPIQILLRLRHRLVSSPR